MTSVASHFKSKNDNYEGNFTSVIPFSFIQNGGKEMNLSRKVDMQERRICSMQKQIDRLKTENEVLQHKNQELLDKELRYKTQLDAFEEIKREYSENIAEVNAIKEQYRQAVYEANQMKKKYAKSFRLLINQFKTQVL